MRSIRATMGATLNELLSSNRFIFCRFSVSGSDCFHTWKWVLSIFLGVFGQEVVEP